MTVNIDLSAQAPTTPEAVKAMITEADKNAATAAYASLLQANGVDLTGATITVVDVVVTVPTSRRRALTAGSNNFVIAFIFEITNIPTSVAASVCAV